MDIKLFTEETEIISTGSVIVPSGDYLQFEIEGLKFRFLFIQDKTDENAQISISKRVETDSETGVMQLSIIISNVHRSSFGSLREPMQVAILNGRNLFVRFSIVSLLKGDESDLEDKILFYTWYLAKNSNNINND